MGADQAGDRGAPGAPGRQAEQRTKVPITSGRPPWRLSRRLVGSKVLRSASNRGGPVDYHRVPQMHRVEMSRRGGRSNISVATPFVWRRLTGLAVAPFPHPAHRTGQAELPHPALGQDVYHVLISGELYHDLGPDHFDRRSKTTQTRRLVARLQNLGFAVQITPLPL